MLGDDGVFYVSPASLELYKNELIKQANIITPNYFETELLSGIKVKSFEDILRALDCLHEKGIPQIIMKGYLMGDELILVGSIKNKRDEKPERFRIRIPEIKHKFTGSGDLFAALLLGWICKGEGVKTACEKAVAGTYFILKRTAMEGGGEMRLVHCRDAIENPAVEFFAEDI